MLHLVVPDLGDGIEKVEVSDWHVRVGDSVAADQDAVEVVTDKASFAIQAPGAGILRKIYFNKGQEAPIGAVLADIEPLS